MKRDTAMPIKDFAPSFLSCQRDFETILRKLFIESKPYSDLLKRAIVINQSDCLSDLQNSKYNQKVQEMTLAKLMKEQYIKIIPKITFGENEKVKTYLMFSIDNFAPNATNPEFRDCMVHIDIICHTDYWSLGDYSLRPLAIAGYIDGILNKARLSGIGTFNFMGCNEVILNEDLSGYSLMYKAIHGSDDSIPPKEDEQYDT